MPPSVSSTPTSSRSLNNTSRSLDIIIVIFYETPYYAPIYRDVPLQNGWLEFGNNPEFYKLTGFPGPGKSHISIFDIHTMEFVPLLTDGGIQVDVTNHPWIILRSRELLDVECINLEICIGTLIEVAGGSTGRMMDRLNMVVADDDDSDDGTYEPGRSSDQEEDISDKDEGMLTEDEEDEAVEMDDNSDEAQVIIDLTMMSDD